MKKLLGVHRKIVADAKSSTKELFLKYIMREQIIAIQRIFQQAPRRFGVRRKGDCSSRLSAAFSNEATLALWRAPMPSALENIFSPQIPSATGEGNLWRKNVVLKVARDKSAKVVPFFSAIKLLPLPPEVVQGELDFGEEPDGHKA